MTDRSLIFAWIRHKLGRGLAQKEVDEMDRLLDAYDASGTIGERHIGPDGLALIKSFEGCRLAAYPDPGTGGDPWTIGWGATGPGIAKGVTWTQAQADARLEQDVARFASQVSRGLGAAPTTQQQFDALVSFHYNTGALLSSTLFKLHKAGDYAGAAAEFGKWVHAGGKVLPGLVARRAAEAALYRKGSGL